MRGEPLAPAARGRAGRSRRCSTPGSTRRCGPGRSVRPGPTSGPGWLDKRNHWERHGFGLWLLRDRATGELAGRGGLQYTDAIGGYAVEAAWAIVPERWGQGLGTELALASVDVALHSLGFDELIAITLPDNVASRRVMDKAGFGFDREIVHAGLAHVLYRRRRC